MGVEIDETGRSGQVLSGFLLNKMEETLNKKEQIILMQNRRGFSPIISCGDCGQLEMCVQCNIPLAYHTKGPPLKCHFCGFCLETVPPNCKDCNSTNIQMLGTGTQKIEDIVKNTFPHASIVRIDMDTSRTAFSLKSAISSFASGEIDPVDTISKHNRLLNAADVPEENRWFLAGPEFVEQLGQANSKLMSDTTGNAAPLRNGKVYEGKVMNMELYMTNNFAASSTSNFFKVLGGHMSSTATANHIAKIEVIRHPESFSDVVRGLHVFGRKVLRSNAIVLSHILID